jgi:hypothetical protein
MRVAHLDMMCASVASDCISFCSVGSGTRISDSGNELGRPRLKQSQLGVTEHVVVSFHGRPRLGGRGSQLTSPR